MIYNQKCALNTTLKYLVHLIVWQYICCRIRNVVTKYCYSIDDITLCSTDRFGGWLHNTTTVVVVQPLRRYAALRQVLWPPVTSPSSSHCARYVTTCFPPFALSECMQSDWFCAVAAWPRRWMLGSQPSLTVMLYLYIVLFHFLYSLHV